QVRPAGHRADPVVIVGVNQHRGSLFVVVGTLDDHRLVDARRLNERVQALRRKHVVNHAIAGAQPRVFNLADVPEMLVRIDFHHGCPNAAIFTGAPSAALERYAASSSSTTRTPTSAGAPLAALP